MLKDAEHGVATAWLCREEKRNALSVPVLAAIEYAAASGRIHCFLSDITAPLLSSLLERRSCFCTHVSTWMSSSLLEEARASRQGQRLHQVGSRQQTPPEIPPSASAV